MVLEDKVEYWHTHDEIQLSLKEYLGLNDELYLAFLRGDLCLCRICQYFARCVAETESGEPCNWGICTAPWSNSDEHDVMDNDFCSRGKPRNTKSENDLV